MIAAAKKVGGFFEDVYKKFIAPGLDAHRRCRRGGLEVDQGKGRLALGQAQADPRRCGESWDWIKQKLGMAIEESEGALDWLRKKAEAALDKLREKIKPIEGPLKVVGATILLLSPFGPVILIAKAAPLVWDALKKLGAWIAKGWEGSRAQQSLLRDTILPAIVSGVAHVRGLLDQAASFVCGHAATVVGGLQTLQQGLGTVPFLSLAQQGVRLAGDMFSQLAAKGSCKLSDLIAGVKGLLQGIYDLLHPILEALRQFLLVLAFGPWALLDDGVWATVLRLQAFVMRTPCLREIAGLARLPGIIGMVGQVRGAIKGFWKILNDPKFLEDKITEAIGGLVAKVPGQLEALIAQLIFGGAGATTHLEGVMRHLTPKVAKMLSDWKKFVKDALWSLLWPWPSVKTNIIEIGKTADSFVHNFATLHFSRATDDLLKLWRETNEILGALYGWFAIAAILIGTVLGAIFGVGAGAVPASGPGSRSRR